MDHRPPPRPESLTSNRDARLRTLARLRRGLAVSCVALIGGLAAFVAQAKPGKSTGTPAGKSPLQTGSKARFAQTPLNATPSSAPSASLSPPPQAPTPAPAAPPPAVVSGGS
jgi:type IV secretory pathway VirB10-like protein